MPPALVLKALALWLQSSARQKLKRRVKPSTAGRRIGPGGQYRTAWLRLYRKSARKAGVVSSRTSPPGSVHEVADIRQHSVAHLDPQQLRRPGELQVLFKALNHR